jgi:hypothetical protein
MLHKDLVKEIKAVEKVLNRLTDYTNVHEKEKISLEYNNIFNNLSNEFLDTKLKIFYNKISKILNERSE